MVVEGGHIALVKIRFNWRNPMTWIVPIEIFFINLWNWFKGDTIIKYNHCVAFILEDGILWVYEAKAEGVVKQRFLDWKFSNEVEGALGLAPKFEFDKSKFNDLAHDSLGIKYDFQSTLFHQLLYQLTDERVWIGQKSFTGAKRRLNCSEFVAYLYNYSTKNNIFENWYMTDPEDLADPNKFTFYKIK